jgi:probable phosphoglycerate mutase
VKAVYSSPLERTRETANAIASECGVEPVFSDDLGEMRVGAWEGMLFQDLESRQEWRDYNAHRSRMRPPGGELIGEVQLRMIRGLECIQTQHPDGLAAVVSHCDPIRALLCHYLGAPLDSLTRFEISTASVSVVECPPWGPKVICLNQTGEIPL